ncbi:embryonic stem cell-specific 5-hydroxymethylcytosine-binding protein [Coffea eugenioides]|uniref:embryonic stem cell-specific 5-hydroxymethylcytosine-binding protein n=1 Tax=Coffea eugenioides TaxID=49369 RepID=UPI000F609DAD|nr:embryonic stem cell-specific 5-hydroxymethylcytosine-binding protein [Coffea eugenioides]
MCGRARCTLRPDDIPRACHLNGRRIRHVDMNRCRPAYNASPGFNLPVVRREDGQGGDGVGQAQLEQGAVVQCMKWGLIPSFTKKTEKPDHFKMFNARSESIREKASFRRLLPNNRCLVAVEGFYEWKKDGSKKQPYYIYFMDGRPLVFAALFDSWKNSEGEVFYTFTIVTTSSSSTLEWLHDRMPVILRNKEATEMWLNGPSSSDFDTILKPYGESDLVWHPVTTAMGKLSFDGPECISEIQLKRDESKTISQFFSKKGANSQADSKTENRTIKGEPMGLQEESEADDLTNHQHVTKSAENDSKPDFSNLSRDEALHIPVKREYEVCSSDTKHTDDESEKLHESPVTKKVRGASEETMVKLEEQTQKTSPTKTHKPGASSVRKKASSSGDKQPTLFSYFGKC